MAYPNLQQNADGSWTVLLSVTDAGVAIDGSARLDIPAGTPIHAAWQLFLAFCGQNNVRVVPQYVFINASGTTGTVLQ